MTDYTSQIMQCFMRLRHEGLVLGMEELMDATRAIDSGLLDEDVNSIKELLNLIWCKSATERMMMLRVWSDVVQHIPEESNTGSVPDQLEGNHPDTKPWQANTPTKPAQDKAIIEEALSVMPTRAPYKPIHGEGNADLSQYYPISKRFMTYTWRYLRREIPDGAEDILDYEATTERAALQGFFISPVYRRRMRNHAHLVLLLDHLGSMTPFHHYLRDLVDTALNNSTLQHVEAYYFHNVPGEVMFSDPHLTQRAATETILASLDEFASVLIVSDGGAARGNNDLDRIVDTEFFLEDLYIRTHQIAWLNPMPEVRWKGTSAEVIAKAVKMYPMDEDGMSNALDVLRGTMRS